MKLTLSSMKLSFSTMKNPIRSRKRKRSMKIKRKEKCEKIPGDFLCAMEFGKEFMVSCPDNSPVTIEKSLQGKKVVGLLFSNIDMHGDPDYDELMTSLKDVYDQLVRSNPDAFEIVFVPICKHRKWSYESSRDFFNNTLLMTLPWLSIPFEEEDWRNHLYKKYKICGTAQLELFDDRRLLLQFSGALGLLTIDHGATLYPFTRARQLELQTQYLAPFLSPNPSFEALLGSYLISFDEHGVKQFLPTICLLQGKEAVGIYLYHGKTIDRHQPPHPKFTKKLKDYRARAGGNFEIVFVNLDFYSGYKSEASFHRFLIKHPRLLALPFKDSKIRSLWFTLAAKGYDCLVTVQLVTLDGGHKKFSVDPYGACVIHEYGFDAYPFTRDMAAKVQMKRLPTQFNLTDIFKATKTNHLIHHNSSNNNQNEAVSFLVRKRVVLYFRECWSDQDLDDDNFRKLRDFQVKDPSLQVLFSSSPTTTPPYVSTNMPNEWLAFPSFYEGRDNGDFIGEVIKYNIPGGYFIAFDDTGKPLNIGDLGLLDHRDAFPFVTDKEVFRDLLITTKEWDIEAGFEHYLA